MEILTQNPLIAYLFIFLARVIDVSLDVFRMLLLTRGYSIPAALIGFFEIIVYLVALGTVFAGGFSDVWKVIAYAGGFATGNLVGIKIEEMMAVGYVVLQVFPCPEHGEKLLQALRDNNYGVTTMSGEGKLGPRQILMVTVKRKNLPHILQIIDEVAPDTFYNTSDVRSIQGGIFPSRQG